MSPARLSNYVSGRGPRTRPVGRPGTTQNSNGPGRLEIQTIQAFSGLGRAGWPECTPIAPPAAPARAQAPRPPPPPPLAVVPAGAQASSPARRTHRSSCLPPATAPAAAPALGLARRTPTPTPSMPQPTCPPVPPRPATHCDRRARPGPPQVILLLKDKGI
jgi:hypothetical protein